MPPLKRRSWGMVASSTSRASWGAIPRPFDRDRRNWKRGTTWTPDVSEKKQRPKTRLEPSRVVLYPFAQHSVRHGDPLEHHGGRYDAPPLASRHRLQILGT